MIIEATTLPFNPSNEEQVYAFGSRYQLDTDLGVVALAYNEEIRSVPEGIDVVLTAKPQNKHEIPPRWAQQKWLGLDSAFIVKIDGINEFDVDLIPTAEFVNNRADALLGKNVGVRLYETDEINNFQEVPLATYLASQSHGWHAVHSIDYLLAGHDREHGAYVFAQGDALHKLRTQACLGFIARTLEISPAEVLEMTIEETADQLAVQVPPMTNNQPKNPTRDEAERIGAAVDLTSAHDNLKSVSARVTRLCMSAYDLPKHEAERYTGPMIAAVIQTQAENKIGLQIESVLEEHPELKHVRRNATT